MAIGQASQRVGLPPKTIRYYEQLRLIQPKARSHAGYRLYGSREIQQLRFIKNARELGIPLRKVATLVETDGFCQGMRPNLRRTLEEEIDSIQNQMAKLRKLKAELQRRHRALASRPYSDHAQGCHCLDPITIKTRPGKEFGRQEGGSS